MVWFWVHDARPPAHTHTHEYVFSMTTINLSVTNSMQLQSMRQRTITTHNRCIVKLWTYLNFEQCAAEQPQSTRQLLFSRSFFLFWHSVPLLLSLSVYAFYFLCFCLHSLFELVKHVKTEPNQTQSRIVLLDLKCILKYYY